MNLLSSYMQKYRLAGAFVFIIGLFLLFGLITAQGVWRMGELTRTIYNHPLVVSNAALTAGLQIAKMHRSMKDVVLADSDVQREGALRAVQLGERRVFTQLDIIRRNILGDEGKKLEAGTRELFIDWQPIRAEVIRLLRQSNRREAVEITRSVGAAHAASLEAEMIELTAYARSKATGFLKSAEAEQQHLAQMTALLSAAGVLLSLLVAIVAIRQTSRDSRLLAEERDKLKRALEEIKTLRGIIPICSYCNQIRDEEGTWKRVEQYVHEHSDASFSHSICPACLETQFPEAAAAAAERKQRRQRTEGR